MVVLGSQVQPLQIRYVLQVNNECPGLRTSLGKIDVSFELPFGVLLIGGAVQLVLTAFEQRDP